MKELIISVLIIFIGLVSCNNSTKINGKNTNLIDTTGFFTARNLRGLGEFTIGKSTYSEILITIKNDIRKDYQNYKESNYCDLLHYFGYRPKYSDFKEDFGLTFTEVSYDTIHSYLKRDFLQKKIFGCPNIREIRMREYYIGEIVINDLRLKFYKDTLYKIMCSQNNEIEEGFKIKYGNGKLINNSTEKTTYGKSEIKKIIWENELLITESQTYYEYKYNGDEYIGIRYSDCYFTIILKNEKTINEIKNCEDVAYTMKKRLEEQSNRKNIDIL